MEKKLQKIYPTDYNFLIAQYIWQAHYQTLSKIFLKEFIKLNLNIGHDDKKCETCVTKYKDFD